MTDAMINALSRKEEAREKVIKAALNVASCRFAQKAEDPGWEADMHDDFLDHAIREYQGECTFVKELEKKEHADALAAQANDRIVGPS